MIGFPQTFLKLQKNARKNYKIFHFPILITFLKNNLVIVLL